MVETSFVATSSNYSSGDTSISVSVPTGTQSNDLVLAWQSCANGIASTPSGWTLLDTDSSTEFGLFYRVGGSGSHNFIQSASGKIRVDMVSYRGGFNISDPIDNYSNTDYTTINNILRAASFSVTEADSNIIVVGGCYSPTGARTFTPPSSPGSFTEDVDDGDVDSDFYHTFSHYFWSSSGPTGVMDTTVSGTAATKHCIGLSLNLAVPSGIGLRFGGMR